MMSHKQVIIKVDNLSKQYAKSNGSNRGEDAFWALRKVSFEVNRGDIIGIIGDNGSGKSTLLKILSGITKPTEGQVILDGRVASVLDVGAGFHPDLTGRENVHLRGELLGMARKEVNQVFDQIAEFSEIGPFIDTAVKFYSDGMFLRLAFSIIIHLDFDVLLLDEVMQVGDQHFRKKTEAKILALANDEAKTLIIVSHNIGELAGLANRFIILDKGELTRIGASMDVLREYLTADDDKSMSLNPPASLEDLHFGTYRLKGLVTMGEDGAEGNMFGYDRPFFITFVIQTCSLESVFPFLVQISDSFNNTVLSISYLTIDPYLRLSKIDTDYQFKVRLPEKLFNFGRYYLSILCRDERSHIAPLRKNVLHFDIVRPDHMPPSWYDNSPAPFRPELQWTFTEATAKDQKEWN